MPRHPTVASAAPAIPPLPRRPAAGRGSPRSIPRRSGRWPHSGLNATTIAARLGLSRRTLFERLQDDPVARAAYDDGLADLVTTAGAKLRELIEAGNVTAIIFTLKVKGGFLTPREASPSLPEAARLST